MLILCRIAIAEKGKPDRKNTLQIPHFFNQHDRCYWPPCKCHVTQKSRNSSVLTITKGKRKKTFRRENLSQYQFKGALIFHESKISEGLTILQFEFSMTSCETRIKCQRLHRSQVTFNGQEKNRRSSIRGPINYPVSKLFAVNNRAHECSYHYRRLHRHVLPLKSISFKCFFYKQIKK